MSYTYEVIISQFTYYPLTWLTHSRGLNKKNIHIHERALPIVFKNFSMCFEGLIAKDKSITIYKQNQQQLVIGIFKGEMGISPIIMTEM